MDRRTTNLHYDELFVDMEDFTPKQSVWNPLEEVEFFDRVTALETDFVVDLFQDAADQLEKFHIQRPAPPQQYRVIGAEAGDDRVDFSQDPFILSLMLIIQEKVLHMSTSELDTFISDRYYNFCEVTSTIPAALQQSLEYGKKTKHKNLGFCDSPALRLVLDVKKGAQDHSSTEVGKVSMLGIRLRDTKPSLKMMMQLSFLFQTACLATHRMDEPSSIPVEMGGCGAPPAWGDYRNLYLSMKTFKNGSYSRVYGTATNEAYWVVRECDHGRPKTPVLANRLRQRQDYLHATFAMHLLVPSQQTVAAMPKPIYKAVGISSGLSGVERRLVRAKLLLGEKDARVEWDREVRIGSVITGLGTVNTTLAKEEKILSKLREEYGGALRANSAFQNLINRNARGNEVIDLVKQGFTLVSTGALSFSYENAKWITDGSKGEIFSLSDIPVSEDMFIRAEVSSEKTMKIPGITLKPIRKHGNASVVTVAKLGLWQISKPMEQWCQEKVNNMLQLRPLYPDGIPAAAVRKILRKDPEWVSDDSMIIGKVYEDLANEISTCTIAVITTDKRLCRQLAQTTNSIVIGVHPWAAAFACGATSYDAQFEVSTDQVIRMFEDGWFARRSIREPKHVYVDTGSTEAALQLMDYDPGSNNYYIDTLLATENNGSRGCTISRRVTDLKVVRERHIIAWPNTVTYETTANTGSNMPRTDQEKVPGRSQKSKLSKFSH